MTASRNRANALNGVPDPICGPLHVTHKPSHVRATTYISDEKNSALTCARTCSVTPGQVSIDDLPRIFGVDSLRPHQVKAIDAAVNGRDVLVVAPTGGGKTLSFVAAGLIRGGLTLIVCPLRSLIADQVRRARELSLPVRC